ncbi:MAG: transglutaminase-like domain-containing protein [Methylacidiphilales bacterium]|nr:transglutaminase-like domain-containing protein [Candidatus Methylacidiphilales bacterium]
MQLHPIPTRSRPSKSLLPASVAAAWLLTAAGLFGQALSSDTGSVKSDAPKPIFEEWVVVVLGGKTCGFGSTVTTETDTPTGPQYLTAHQEEFVVKRLGTSLKMTDTSKVTEDADGGVLSFDEISDSGSAIESRGVRRGDRMVVSSRGQTQSFYLPRLSALGPEAVRRLSLAVPLKPGQPYSFDTFSTDYPQADVVEEGHVVGQETHDVRGVQRQLWKLTSAASYMPGLLSTVWVDDQGNDVESLTVIPGLGQMHEYVTDRAECMKQPEGAEIFAATLIHPQRAIPSPHDLRRAVYRLVPLDPSRKLNLWNQGEQRVLSSEAGSCEVEVTAPDFTAADATWLLPHADTPELHRYLQASAYLEVNTPEIQALARQAVGKERNPVLAAHRIERFVRDYISRKDLDIGFASAEETAKSREGDCTEHAVLCAALGRAVGLPTRCVVGLGYIPPGDREPTIADTVDSNTGIFGFHMWAEAWIGPDQWVPMDAALDGFDVGHIAITKSALEEVDPMIDLNAPIFQLMQSLKIEVVKTVGKRDMPLTAAPSPAPNGLPPLD